MCVRNDVYLFDVIESMKRRNHFRVRFEKVHMVRQKGVFGINCNALETTLDIQNV